jgi:nicotinamidase-related amidase
MKTSLVIIDMQESFVDYACDKKVSGVYLRKIESICRAIRTAKKHGWTIVVVEYEGYGYTIDPIVEAIGKYRKVRVVTKCIDDGSDELEPLLKRLKIQRVVYTGCNSDACVLATVKEMVKYEMPKVRHQVYIPGTMTFNSTTIRANSPAVIRKHLHYCPSISRLVA